jgi:NADH:ubiquinone oxidoreductase subunit F (NADH-binding)/NADH:ubiquinone oxidoreductase subunit E
MMPSRIAPGPCSALTAAAASRSSTIWSQTLTSLLLRACFGRLVVRPILTSQLSSAMIIQALYEVQQRCGYLPREELIQLSRRLNVPLHRVHEVASFYPHFRLQPPPRVDVRVCRDMACHLRGSAGLRRSLEELAAELDQGQIAVGGVSCLGQCDAAPNVVSINDHVYHGLSEEEIHKRLRMAAAQEPLPRQHADRSPTGWRIDVYEGKPRYEALRRFIEKRDGDAILKELETAGLRGMGGAGFPTFRKWSAVRAAPGEAKYVVCNADESEPGTFKDRELLRRAPYLVIEGMVLAGLVTGATHGWVYIRHEYHDELEALREAIEQARIEGVVGENVLGSRLPFALEIFVSPGGYIQGEESALLEAMEDRRGEPRNKPPFPVTHGLFNKPTVINNVETLAWVPSIILRGGAWYRDQGTNGATGLRLVSISGDVNKPGVYEVPFGQTVRQLIAETAGGMLGKQKLKAIAPSGPSGGFLPVFLPAAALPKEFVEKRLSAGANGLSVLDLTLDIGTLSAIGSMLGAAFVVYGEKADMVEQALNCTEFFRNESCGKCVPCRLGSEKLVELIGALRQRRWRPDHPNRVNEITQAMTLASICGLGQVAANPIASVLKYFPQEIAKYGATTSLQR